MNEWMRSIGFPEELWEHNTHSQALSHRSCPHRSWGPSGVLALLRPFPPDPYRGQTMGPLPQLHPVLGATRLLPGRAQAV
jgi:hypothetical protein